MAGFAYCRATAATRPVKPIKPMTADHLHYHHGQPRHCHAPAHPPHTPPRRLNLLKKPSTVLTAGWPQGWGADYKLQRAAKYIEGLLPQVRVTYRTAIVRHVYIAPRMGHCGTLSCV